MIPLQSKDLSAKIRYVFITITKEENAVKRMTALLLSLMMVLSLAGCAQADNQSSSSPAPAQSEPVQSEPAQTEPVEIPEPASSYPMTLTDQAGRTVIIPAQPERLVSGYYISTSLLIALGQTDKLVGVEAKADKRAIYRLSAPEILDLPSVGSAKEFDLEGCAALEPDLVILPIRLESAASTLEELGITALLINPESQELLEEAIDLIAQATNSGDKARELASFASTRGNLLQEALHDVEQPRVYLGGNSSFLSTAGGQMYQSDLIAQAGGENVAQDIEDAYWAEVSYEQLLAWDPEYIILASDAGYTCEDVLNDPSLTGCTAVAEGNVFQFPNKAEAWDSPVPSGVLGAIWLASILHPDRCSENDRDLEIERYYERFYGFSYSQA